MNEQLFDTQKYVQSLKSKLITYLETDKKYYFEVSGNFFDQTFLSSFCEDFPKDLWRQVFSEVKFDMDILLCIKADTIIQHEQNTESKLREEVALFLKRIEHQFGGKPQLIINFIDIENMYDLVFGFETYFQKLGYRTWEKYKIKNFSWDVEKIFSEDDMENDDHIPAMKKFNLLVDFEPGSGKTITALTQIKFDQGIGIDATFMGIEPFFDPTLGIEHPFNLLAYARYLNERKEGALNKEQRFQIKKEEIGLFEKAFQSMEKEFDINDFLFAKIDENTVNLEKFHLLLKEKCKNLS